MTPRFISPWELPLHLGNQWIRLFPMRCWRHDILFWRAATTHVVCPDKTELSVHWRQGFFTSSELQSEPCPSLSRPHNWFVDHASTVGTFCVAVSFTISVSASAWRQDGHADWSQCVIVGKHPRWFSFGGLPSLNPLTQVLKHFCEIGLLTLSSPETILTNYPR